MGIEVKLEAFEGPLDLLLHLIEKNKIDIYDIPIVEITEQYLSYVEKMKVADLEIMSDFVVVGAQLVNIKSKMLLPVKEEEADSDFDPRDELVRRLLEYKMFKFSAGLLKEKTKEAALLLFRVPSIPEEVKNFEEKPQLTEIIGDLTLAKLKSIFDFVIKKQIEKKDPVRSQFGKIKKETITLADCIKNLRNYGTKQKEMNLKHYLLSQPDKTFVIVHFLAILEMMKMGLIEAKEEGSEEILICFLEDRELTEEEYRNLGE